MRAKCIQAVPPSVPVNASVVGACSEGVCVNTDKPREIQYLIFNIESPNSQKLVPSIYFRDNKVVKLNIQQLRPHLVTNFHFIDSSDTRSSMRFPSRLMTLKVPRSEIFFRETGKAERET